MSVLIKGCPIPSGCATCPFCSEPFEEKDRSISYHCHVNVDGVRGKDVSSIVDAMYRSAKKGELITLRPDWCPLVEVPTPHGRLIDADYLKEHITACATNGRPLHTMELSELLEAIDDVPTVIEEEE